VSVKEHEWPEVGGWVYKNFDLLAGVSFLPHMEVSSTYTQLPYETITKDQYEIFMEEMPTTVDWTKLGMYERGEDTVIGTREFACLGSSCEIVEAAQPLEVAK
jgi:ribonucleoside-diphosphate reductase alpha chain